MPWWPASATTVPDSLATANNTQDEGTIAWIRGYPHRCPKLGSSDGHGSDQFFYSSSLASASARRALAPNTGI
jgi:hypothetical protein